MIRIGHGIDAHPLVAGRKLILGGVQIEHARGLQGYSDADVLAHAVTDAILGAMRAGDIGQLFPDSDPAYKGVDSLVLLSQVAELARERGYKILDIDCVVMAQAPRLAPYRDKMRENLAAALGIEVDSVGVKATTTEGLGFTGEGLGIQVSAVALLDDGRTPTARCSS